MTNVSPDGIRYIAARMYLQYRRKNGHDTGKSDEEILTAFQTHWYPLFSSPAAQQPWLDRAEEAVAAYTDWMERRQ